MIAKLKEHKLFIGFILLCTAVYASVVMILLKKTGIYAPTYSYDRYFSLDDGSYSRLIYSTKLYINSGQSIRHILLIQFANYFTLMEQFIFGKLSLEMHSVLIVSFQIIIFLCSLIYLYKILVEIYKVKTMNSLLILGIYTFSVSNMIFTLLPESFSLSAAILVTAFYYMHRKNWWASTLLILLGVLAGGVTITNIVLWAVMLFVSPEKSKTGKFRLIEFLFLIGKKVLIITSAVALLAFVIWVLPVGEYFYSNLDWLAAQPERFTVSFSFFEMIKHTIFGFFGSTSLYIDTVLDVPTAFSSGRTILFVPSGNIPVLMLMGIWIILFIVSIYKNIREPLLLVPMVVLIYNFLLHSGFVQFGLNEAFIYSLHHLFAQVLIVALLFKNNKDSKILTSMVAVYFVGMLIVNIIGFTDLWSYITSFN